MNDKADFFDVCGITFETAQELATGDGPRGEKQLATLQWLREIIALEAVERELAAIGEQLSDGARMPAPDFRRAWDAMDNATRASFTGTRQHAEALHPSGGGWFERAGIDDGLLRDTNPAARDIAIETALATSDLCAAYGDERAALDIAARLLAMEENAPPVDTLLEIAAALDALPSPPPGAVHSECWQWCQRLDGMTLPELEGERKRKESELAAGC